MPAPATAIPATGLPAGVATGPLIKRAVAQLIDLLVPVLIAILAGAATGTSGVGEETAAVVSFLAWLLGLAWVALVCWMFATRSAGPGMRAMKLQLVGLRNGRPIGWARFLVRSLILALLSATVVGLVIMLVFLVRHPRKQGWHDLVAESVVIKQRALAPRQPVRSGSPARPQKVEQAVVAEPAASPPPLPTARGVDPRPAGTGPRPAPAAAERVPLREPGPLPSPARPPVAVPEDQGAAALDDGRPLDEGWCAVLDDGRALEVSGLVLLGRNPQPRPGEEGAELIKVADETRTVSKTHLSLSVDANGPYVMDRDSTNGTTVTHATGASRTCPPGDVVSVGDGVIVSFGDHWLRIERRPER